MGGGDRDSRAERRSRRRNDSGRRRHVDDDGKADGDMDDGGERSGMRRSRSRSQGLQNRKRTSPSSRSTTKQSGSSRPASRGKSGTRSERRGEGREARSARSSRSRSRSKSGSKCRSKSRSRSRGGGGTGESQSQDAPSSSSSAGWENALVEYGEHGDPYDVLILSQYREKFEGGSPTEVVVKVEASTVSRTDCELRRNLFHTHIEFPYAAGCDLIGKVVCVGRSARMAGRKVGDRVAAVDLHLGGNARYVTVENEILIDVPEDLDAAEAACLLRCYVAGYQCLHGPNAGRRNRLAGSKVLVMGGNGCLGQAVIQLAKAAGAKRVFATGSGSTSKRVIESSGGIMLGKGPDEWLARTRADMDVVIDAVCADGYESSRKALRRGGRLHCLGAASDLTGSDSVIAQFLARQDPAMRPPSLAEAAKKVGTRGGDSDVNSSFYDLFESVSEDPDRFERDVGRLFKMLRDGSVRPTVVRRCALHEVAAMHADVEAGGLNGFVVCEPFGPEKEAGDYDDGRDTTEGGCSTLENSEYSGDGEGSSSSDAFDRSREEEKSTGDNTDLLIMGKSGIGENFLGADHLPMKSKRQGVGSQRLSRGSNGPAPLQRSGRSPRSRTPIGAGRGPPLNQRSRSWTPQKARALLTSGPRVGSPTRSSMQMGITKTSTALEQRGVHLRSLTPTPTRRRLEASHVDSNDGQGRRKIGGAGVAPSSPTVMSWAGTLATVNASEVALPPMPGDNRGNKGGFFSFFSIGRNRGNHNPSRKELRRKYRDEIRALSPHKGGKGQGGGTNSTFTRYSGMISTVPDESTVTMTDYSGMSTGRPDENLFLAANMDIKFKTDNSRRTKGGVPMKQRSQPQRLQWEA